MYERYTAKARRVIFFSRYEASQFGSPYIETEHLLLGLLREDIRLLLRLQIEDPWKIRDLILTKIPRRPSTSTSVELPLSNALKRVLKYAADETEALKHRHIGTEHLLLGLLDEENTLAAEILREHKINVQELRQRLSEPTPPPAPPASSTPPPTHRKLPTDSIEIHGTKWDAETVHNRVKICGEIFWHWHQQPWHPCDIAVHRVSGRISFDLTLAANSQDYEVVKAGWKKDHCAVCRWELFESTDDLTHGTGNTNGREWLCSECYEKFL